jgi:hypothetical protein
VDVGRLEIAVDDAFFVGGLQRTGDLGCQLSYLGQGASLTVEASQAFQILGRTRGRILIATSLCSFWSRARKTSPIPPSPNLLVTS